jgi:crotonobetainyl-CoA:carnitine CoA-transferase CaiB-like acyl-CoA transferase
MFDSALANLTFKGYEFLVSGHEPALYAQQTASPKGMFDTADGVITITCAGDKMFKALCLNVVEQPLWLEDPRYNAAPERERHAYAFMTELRAIFGSRPSAYWSERCKRAGIPCGQVRSPGAALLSEEALERGLVFNIPHPTAGKTPAIGLPVRLSATPASYGPAPRLGEHGRTVLRDLLGYDDARIDDLAATGAIGLPNAAPAEAP